MIWFPAKASDLIPSALPFATVQLVRIRDDSLSGNQIDGFSLNPAASPAPEDGETFDLVVRCIYPILLGLVLVG